jgi:hypothetical protein
MRLEHRGSYPAHWGILADAVERAAGNRCIRCGHPKGDGFVRRMPCDESCTHKPDGKMRILTVHHLDGDKANDYWWNLLADQTGDNSMCVVKAIVRAAHDVLKSSALSVASREEPVAWGVFDKDGKRWCVEWCDEESNSEVRMRHRAAFYEKGHAEYRPFTVQPLYLHPVSEKSHD